ncbi:uncharacterized protein MELLADRAFT_84225 [Melampsora larici-populina 98AG31]|uniref:FAD-binding PCMH-type domain-containing protein n=1 Tax=Melampsora larici-populina (strain 98AG31 / pathotype 3-4-7) TaxID=747676 RepID=F4SC13_MELLP|nr:uncharacterized protein MELLADRAFT_84225 [Melampsora larici-populina 98AG31]EGF97800.1 hypothetical protein MELLADRAFT_84225 [Melampsora larici-populina 98AG31]
MAFLPVDGSVSTHSNATQKPSSDKSPSSDIISCLNAIGDKLLTSNSPEWLDAIKPYNLRIAPIPAAMIFPKNEESVSAIVACASQFPQTRLAPLCGGHSFASFGLGGVDGAVVVNMQNFKDMSMLPAVDGAEVVKVGGGVLVRELTLFLIKNGGLSWPHARYTEVGVVGSAIGGGFGPSSRLVGTTLDNVVAVNIVLPSGKLVRATKSENPDIFFAVLGAGSSFGIIVSIELRVHKPYANPVTYIYQWQNPTLEEATTAFTTFQDFGINSAPPELGIRIRLGLPSNMFIQGLYYGDIKEFPSIMKPVLSKLPMPTSANISASTFAESEALFTGPLEAAPAEKIHGVTYTRSLLTFEPLKASAISSFIARIYDHGQEKRPAGFQIQIFSDLWGGFKSYSSKMITKSGEYSFPHSQALLLIRSDGVFLNQTTPDAWPKDGIAFTQSFTKPLFDSIQRPRSYPNYRDSAYSQAEWSTRYYDDQYSKLQRIKTQIDPIGMMSANPQSILPSSFAQVRHNTSGPSV